MSIGLCHAGSRLPARPRFPALALALVCGLGASLVTEDLRAQPSVSSSEASSSLSGFADIPAPYLETTEPAIRAQLEGARSEAAAAFGQASLSAQARAEAVARLARLYLLYGFFESAGPAFELARDTTPEDPRWHYYLGAIAHQERQLDKAKAHLTDVLTRRPGDIATRIRLGQIALEQDRIDEASTIFGQLAEQNPRLAVAHHGSAQVAEAAGNYALAAERYEQALALQPEATALHYPLALAYRQAGDLDRARIHLAARGAGEIQFPDPLITSLSQENVGSAPLVAAANKAMSESDFETAIALFRSALERTPDDLRTKLTLANALSRHGNAEAAITTYQQALAQADGPEPVSHYNLGILLLERGNLDDAIDSFVEAVRLAPTFTSAHFNLAAAYEQRGDMPRAAAAASKAATLAPDDDDILLLLARIAIRQGQGSAAAAHLDTVLTRRPANVEGWLIRGLLATQQRDAAGATEAFRRALDASPDDTQRARAHLGLAELPGTDSIDHLETAARLLPSNADVARRLAAAYGRAGRLDDAAERYARAASLSPGDPRTHFGRATSLILAGRDAEAARALENGLTPTDNAIPLRHALARLLATSADSAVRDGTRALSMAQEVFRSAPSIDHGESVAMALAELGRFEEAADWERQLIGQAQANNRHERIPTLQARLEQYQRGEPVRDPWRRGGPN